VDYGIMKEFQTRGGSQPSKLTTLPIRTIISRGGAGTKEIRKSPASKNADPKQGLSGKLPRVPERKNRGKKR